MNAPPVSPVDLPLKPYHLPDPVSWWPPAYGWWVLSCLVLLALYSCYLLFRYWRRLAWKRAAVAELKVITSEYERQGDVHLLSRQLSVLLRRVCLSRCPSLSIGHLHGEAWLAHLDKTAQGRKKKEVQLFQSEDGRVMLQCACDKRSQADGRTILALCRQWLKQVGAVSGRDK